MGTQILLYLSVTAAPARLRSRFHPKAQVRVGGAEGLGSVGGGAEIAELPVRLPTFAAVVTFDDPKSHRRSWLPPEP